MRCTISGSFRRFYCEITQVIELFENNGITVSSPRKSTPINPTEEFVRLESDSPTLSDGEIEDEHLRKQREADFIYVVNPGGHIGISAAYEIAKAEEWDIPIYALEQPADPMLSSRKITVMSPQQLVQSFAKKPSQ